MFSDFIAAIREAARTWRSLRARRARLTRIRQDNSIPF